MIEELRALLIKEQEILDDSSNKFVTMDLDFEEDTMKIIQSVSDEYGVSLDAVVNVVLTRMIQENSEKGITGDVVDTND